MNEHFNYQLREALDKLSQEFSNGITPTLISKFIEQPLNIIKSSKKKKKEIHYVIGTPGSGKSTYCIKLSKKHKLLIMDGDYFILNFAKNNNIQLSDDYIEIHHSLLYNDLMVYFELIFNYLIENNYSFIFTTPHPNTNDIKTFNFHKYIILLYYIYTDFNISKIRAKKRFQDNKLKDAYEASKSESMRNRIFKQFFNECWPLPLHVQQCFIINNNITFKILKKWNINFNTNNFKII